ncbi:hypothetical protein MPSEU_000888000 [Mayamaea pseudoterrestris]|nr:hypothetical protein MPSEU_000888000 [Mayamaea pseudoterrestris]
MLLQIDVYPNQESVSSQTVHVCLATNFEKPGLLLSIGRKATTVAIADKAVSREHALLTIKTTNDKLIDENNPHSPVLATTEKEIEACEASLDKCCAVYTNLGKLGSFVVHEHTSSHNAAPLNSEKNDSDDDATDDEDELPMSALQSQSGMPSLSNATKALVKDPSAVTLRAVGRDESLVLTHLSLLRPNKDCDYAMPSRVIIQVGKGGSTIVLKRMPILFIVGSADKAHYKFMSQLHQIDAHYISAHHDDAIPNSMITHHVTPSRSVSPKQVTSWLLQRKIVHPDYLQALLDRSSPTDDLPPEIEPSDDGNTFWKQSPSSALKETWKSWIFLSYDQRDAPMEAMIAAAGSKVIQIYKLGKTVAEQVHEFEKQLSVNSSLSKDKCFMFDSKSKKKIVVELHNTLGILAVPMKDVAKHLTYDPKQPDGSKLHSMDPADYVADKTVVRPNTDKHHSKSSAKRTDQHVEQDVAMEDDVESPRTSVEATQKAKKSASPAANPSARKAKYRNDVPKDLDAMDTETNSPQSGSMANADTFNTDMPEPAKTKKEESASSEKTPPVSNATFLESSKDDGAAADEWQSAARRSDEERPLKRQELNSNAATDGWLAAAPKGKKRKAFIRDKAEICEATGADLEELLDVAPTIRMAGLIAPAQGQPTARSVHSGPNYKAFRKNSVPSPPRARLQLRVHTTRVSEAEIHAATQLEELEEQSRRADALFAGPARAGGTTRRR